MHVAHPTPDDAGDASFLGPSRDPNQKARARQRPQKQQPKKNSPQASPETQKQQNTVNSSVLRARARRPENQREKARTAQHASQPQQKQNGQNNSPPLSTAVFDSIYSVL